jgi:hypothetical protein
MNGINGLADEWIGPELDAAEEEDAEEGGNQRRPAVDKEKMRISLSLSLSLSLSIYVTYSSPRTFGRCCGGR